MKRRARIETLLSEGRFQLQQRSFSSAELSKQPSVKQIVSLLRKFELAKGAQIVDPFTGPGGVLTGFTVTFPDEDSANILQDLLAAGDGPRGVRSVASTRDGGRYGVKLRL